MVTLLCLALWTDLATRTVCVSAPVVHTQLGTVVCSADRTLVVVCDGNDGRVRARAYKRKEG